MVLHMGKDELNLEFATNLADQEGHKGNPEQQNMNKRNH